MLRHPRMTLSFIQSCWHLGFGPFRFLRVERPRVVEVAGEVCPKP